MARLMQETIDRMDPVTDMTWFLERNLSRLSDRIPAEQILRDGRFGSTQPADTQLPHSLCFCESAKYVKTVATNPSVTCVITTQQLSGQFTERLGVVVSNYPRMDFFILHNRLAQSNRIRLPFAPVVQKTARIDSSATIEEHCFIGNEVQIGAGARVLNNSYLSDGTVIGPNAVVGAEGLEFERLPDRGLLKVTHAGGVYIGRGVEIMANSVVCRDVYLGYTRIGAGTKIGPLCSIGHHAEIGENGLISGNSIVSGSAKIGNGVRIGPSVTIAYGISIGDHAEVTLGATVVKSVPANRKVSGFFALDHVKALKQYAALSQKE